MVSYSTLKQLISAFKKKEIPKEYLEDGEKYPVRLTLDNDTTYVYVGEDCIFRMDPVELTSQALDLLGIPWEHC